ncbi:MAG: hypothetical protein ABUL72_03810, partial [Armatimonadota bacterium]
MNARELIGVKGAPAEYKAMAARAEEATAYYFQNPYPWYAFSDWNTEDRGPLPRCMPLVRNTINRGARWLFGKSPAITIPSNRRLEEFIVRCWDESGMASKMVTAAQQGAREGGVVIMFRYDESTQPPLKFVVLSVKDQCRLFFDPHDVDTLLMLRVQYPYYRASEQRWYWHRQEWTDDIVAVYDDVPDTLSVGG